MCHCEISIYFCFEDTEEHKIEVKNRQMKLEFRLFASRKGVSGTSTGPLVVELELLDELYMSVHIFQVQKKERAGRFTL